MSCRICLDESVDLIDVFTGEGLNLKISEVIAQHFWFRFHKRDKLSKKICKNCWNIINHWHLFYSEVEKRQKCLEQVCLEEARIYQSVTEVVDLDSPEVVILAKNEGGEDEDGMHIQYTYNYADQFVNTVEEESSNAAQVQDEITIESSTSDEMEQEEDTIIRKICNLKCDLCTTGAEVKFNTFADLKSHYEQSHNIIGYVMCCNKLLFQKQDVLQHIAMNHSQIEVYRCDFCNKCFTDESLCSKHIQEHKLDPHDKDPLSNDVVYVQTTSTNRF